VIPKEAREKFNINAGDTLFVIGDEEMQGIAIVKADLLEGFALQILQGIGYFDNKENLGGTENEENGGRDDE